MFNLLLKSLVFVIFLVLAVKNRHEVVLHGFFATEIKMPMAVLVLAIFALGLFSASLAFLPRLKSWRRRSVLPSHKSEDQSGDQQDLRGSDRNGRAGS